MRFYFMQDMTFTFTHPLHTLNIPTMTVVEFDARIRTDTERAKKEKTSFIHDAGITKKIWAEFLTGIYREENTISYQSGMTLGYAWSAKIAFMFLISLFAQYSDAMFHT